MFVPIEGGRKKKKEIKEPQIITVILLNAEIKMFDCNVEIKIILAGYIQAKSES